MDHNHPDVKFGKTGILLVNLGTQILQVGGISENTYENFFQIEE